MATKDKSMWILIVFTLSSALVVSKTPVLTAFKMSLA